MKLNKGSSYKDFYVEDLYGFHSFKKVPLQVFFSKKVL